MTGCQSNRILCNNVPHNNISHAGLATIPLPPHELYMLRVSPICCNKFQAVIDCAVSSNTRECSHIAVCCPLVRVDLCARIYMRLYYRQQSSSIPLLNNLHKTQRRLLLCVHHAEYPVEEADRDDTVIKTVSST